MLDSEQDGQPGILFCKAAAAGWTAVEAAGGPAARHVATWAPGGQRVRVCLSWGALAPLIHETS